MVRRMMVAMVLVGFMFGMLRAEEKAAVKKSEPMIGVQVFMRNNGAVDRLIKVLPQLAEQGLNVVVTEISYGYAFESHPELRASNPCTKEKIKELVKVAREHEVRLVPLFMCLGHQSWDKWTYSLLTKYPEFDETPGMYEENKGIYCRSWCPLHPDVNKVVFALMDELIDVFEADGIHVGMDEVFLIGEDSCPRCKGKDTGELFAKAVNDIYNHVVKEKKVEMFMWADRLINAKEIRYGRWEASANGTWKAIDLIPKDIVLCDWHYEPRDGYESVDYFAKKGFTKVWPCSWRNMDAAKKLIDYSKEHGGKSLIGHLCTTWGAIKIEELVDFGPLKYAVEAFKKD